MSSMPNVTLQNTYQLFIGGKWRDASDGVTFTTSCPANGAPLAKCAEATRDDVDLAVQEAWKAFASWKHVTVNERAAILNKIADIIDANTEHLAMVESLDNGKPIRETMAGDIPMAVLKENIGGFAAQLQCGGNQLVSRSGGNVPPHLRGTGEGQLAEALVLQHILSGF